MALAEDSKLLQLKMGEVEKLWAAVPEGADGKPDPNNEQKQAIHKLNGEIDELGAKISESKQFQEARDRQAEWGKALNAPNGRPNFGGAPEANDGFKSYGRTYTESKQYQSLIKSVAPSGSVSADIQVAGYSQPVEIKNLITDASLTRQAGGSGMIRPDYQGVVPLFLRPLTIRDVITVGQTGSDTVEYTAITAFDNQAAPTAEATAVPTGSNTAGNGLKPQSGLNTVLVQTSVKTIPTWIPITRQALADAPQMETYINNFLMQGVEIKLEDQMITGNNSGANFQGLDNTPGITIQPFVTDPLTTMRKALTAVRVIGRARPTAFLMNPYDWEALDLTKDSQGRYYFGGPTQLGIKTAWGTTVVDSEAVPQGTFYVGDMKQAVLWDRERANIRVSDAPYDMFLRNMLAILCELRAAFGVLRPSAIVRGDSLNGPNS